LKKLFFKSYLCPLCLASLFLLMFFCFFPRHAMFFCDLPGEDLMFTYLGIFGDERSAWQLAELISEAPPSADCATCEIDRNLYRLCNRYPAERERIIEYIANEILEKDKPHFNRVQLISALELLTGESFERSGFPMIGWREGQIPGNEKENIERGLEYFREWWNERRTVKGI